MAEHLKIFNTTAEYDAVVGTDNEPSVSHVIESNGVEFKDLTPLVVTARFYFAYNNMDRVLYSTSNVSSLSINGEVQNEVKTSYGLAKGTYDVEYTLKTPIIENAMFLYCYSATTISIPSRITSIGYTAFEACQNITSFVIPDNITKIESSTFYGCRKLQNINIPSGVTSIGRQAFQNCSKLTNLELPDSLLSIDNLVFCYCGITSMTIPKNVSFIGDRCFSGCQSLATVTMKSLTPPSLGGSNVFVETTCQILVPNQSLNAYKTAEYWSGVADRIIGY